MAFSASAAYQKIWLADFFHNFPHLDFHFIITPSTFDPDVAEYREALGFWFAIPLVWCALLWLVFLIFFCCRCCQKSQRKEKKTTCTRIFVGLMLLIGCGALAIGYYGNEAVDDGVDGFVKAVEDTNATVENSLDLLDSLQNRTLKIKNIDLPVLKGAAHSIPDVNASHQINNFLNEIESSVSKANASVNIIHYQAENLNTEQLVSKTNDLEYYRHMGTIVAYSVFIFIFLFVFAGILKKSKCLLIMVAAALICLMVVIWGATSLYLSLSIAAGDLCINPDAYVLSKVNRTVKRDVLTAYIKCDDPSKPYEADIEQAQVAITLAISDLKNTSKLFSQFNISQQVLAHVTSLQGDLNFTSVSLSSLLFLVGSCEGIHKTYNSAVNSVCHTALIGLAFLALSSAVVGLSTVLVIFCSAFSWPYFGRRSRGYARVDDTDPFLPGLPPYEGYGSIRRVDSFQPTTPSQQFVVNNGDRQSMRDLAAGESLPSTYQSGHYIQQYHNLAPGPRNIRQPEESEF